MVFRIIEAQTQTFQAPGWSFYLHFDDVGAAIPERSDIGDAVIFQPLSRPDQLTIES